MGGDTVFSRPGDLYISRIHSGICGLISVTYTLWYMWFDIGRYKMTGSA